MNKIEIRKLSIRKCKAIMKRTTGKKGKKRGHDMLHATKIDIKRKTNLQTNRVIKTDRDEKICEKHGFRTNVTFEWLQVLEPKKISTRLCRLL